MQQVKAVVALAKGEPVSSTTINVPDPGPGEAVVKVQACGVCHTDLHYREGGINDDFPFLLGHEAAGIVEAVGPDVTGVAPGDFVVLNWRAVCGDCRACHRGEPWYCFTTHNATQKMTLARDGTELSPALGIGAFAEKTLVAAGQCTKVDPSARAGGGRPARLRRDGRHRRRDQHRRVARGKSVAVIGCGGVGAAAIAGAALAGAARSSRSTSTTGSSSWRTQIGATHTVNSQESTRSRRSGADLPPAAPARGCGRRHRRGRPPGDLEAGVLRPRPRRHRRAGRRTDAGHAGPRHPAHRRLRPRRLAEVLLVRRLPALARLPDARRPLPAGPARPRRVRDRGDRPRRRRGRLRQDAPRATCSVRWWCSDGPSPCGSTTPSSRGRSPWTARPTTSTTTSG